MFKKNKIGLVANVGNGTMTLVLIACNHYYENALLKTLKVN